MTTNFTSTDEASRKAENFSTPERDRLSPVFDRVHDPRNWKNPIDRVLTEIELESIGLRYLGRRPRTTLQSIAAGLTAVEEAIIFFTGSEPTFIRTAEGNYRVRAAGYYQAIGA